MEQSPPVDGSRFKTLDVVMDNCQRIWMVESVEIKLNMVQMFPIPGGDPVRMSICDDTRSPHFAPDKLTLLVPETSHA